MARVSVLGSGAWGTTLAQVLCDAGHEVLVWGRNEVVVAEINDLHTNTKFLPGIILPNNLNATTDIKKAFEFGESIVLAIPAQTLRANLKIWAPIFPKSLPIISTLKGIESDTMSRMTEVVIQELGTDISQIGLITGPNLAGELSLRQPAGAVAASVNPKISQLMIDLFTVPYFRVYPSTDLVGCELAGAAKSVIALAVGMTIGMDLGENTQAMVITRGLSEVARFGASYGAQPMTFLGLAGMGDIVAIVLARVSHRFKEERARGEVENRFGAELVHRLA